MNIVSRRSFVANLGAAGATAALAPAVLTKAAAPPKRPNFVFVISDQMRADALGVSGNPFCQTPTLDALANKGTRFANAYCPYALCTPSRGAMFSGVYPHTSGLDHNVYNTPSALDDPRFKLRPTWPELLRGNGYFTTYIGKWHLGDANPGIFDEWGGYNSLQSHWMGAPQTSEYRSDYETRQAIDFLDKRHARPFLLALSYYPPHTPYDPPAKYTKIYADKNIDHPGYYGGITAVDHDLGLVLARLRELGVEKDTFVIFTADHGETFGQRYASAHKTVCYDDSAKVPFLFSWPAGIPRRQVYQGGVNTLDIMPTVLEAAGIPIPPRAQGVSHLRDLRERKLGWKLPVFIENITGTETVPEAASAKPSKKNQIPGFDHKGTERAVRTPQWKLILRQPQRDELYNLVDDPAEKMDLFHDPAQQAKIAELAGLIKAWGQKTADPIAVEFGSRYT